MSAADGRMAFGLAGAAIGAYFGFPGLGFMLGSMLGSLIFPPEGQEIEGPRLADLAFSDSKYGSPIPILYGTMRMGGTYVWATDIVERVKKSKESAGKGGGGSTTTRTYTYFANFLWMGCESPTNFPVDNVSKIFADKKVIADFSNTTEPVIATFLTGLAGDAGVFDTGSLRINTGAENQFPDVLVETHVGVGLTPAYRGVCTITFDDMPLLNFGNRIPQIEAVITTNAVNIFPFISIPWSALTRHLYSPDGVRLFLNQDVDFPEIVNSQTREFIIAPGERALEPQTSGFFDDGEQYTGFYDVDRKGRGITVDGQFGGPGFSVGLHDVNTGAAFGRSGVNSLWVGGTTSEARFAGRLQQYQFHYGLGVEDNQWGWWTTTISAWPPESVYAAYGKIEKLGSTWTTDGVGNGINAELDSSGIRGVVVDDEGEVWMFTNRNLTDGVMEIHRMRPGGGVEQTFEFPGHSAEPMPTGGYERTTNSLFWKEGSTFYRWSIDTETLHDRTVDTTASVDNLEAMYRKGSVNGEVLCAHASNTGWDRIDLVNMRVVKTYDVTDFGGSSVVGIWYDSYLNAVVGRNNGASAVGWYFMDRSSGEGVTLESILNDLDTRAGYVPGVDTDASNHSGTNIPGWIVAGRTQIKSVKQSLAELYQFLVVEEEHMIVHPSRGTATVDALVSADLGASQDRKTSNDTRLEEVRAQDVELPRQIEYSVIEGAMDYQSQIVSARRIREIVNTERVAKRTYPVNITVDEAQQRVETALNQAWMDRTRYQFSLMPEKMLLSPGDTVTIDHNGQGHVITLTQVDFGANNMVECVGVGFPVPSSVLAAEADTLLANIAGLNTSTSGGSSGSFETGVIESVINSTHLIMLDVPLINDDFEVFPNTGIMVAAAGINGGQPWGGANISKGTNISEDTAFAEWMFYNQTQAGLIGRTTSILGAIAKQNNRAGRYQLFPNLDTTSSVSVIFPQGTSLSSVTFQQLVQEQNAFLIGDEIVQVMTIVDDGDGAFTFSNFLRGRKGTEEQDSHTAFEDVVQLTDTQVQIRETSLTELDDEFLYRAFSITGVLETPVSVSHTDTGKIIAPRPVGHVIGTKSGSDWTIAYKRRGRFQSNMQSTDAVPLSQTDHDYEVDIFLEDQTTIIRTITSTASANGSVVTVDADPNVTISVHYDQLDLEADFAESPIVSPYPLYRIMCKIYQLEEKLTGTDRGFVKTAQLEDFPEIPTSDANYSDTVLILQANALNVVDKSPKRGFLNPISGGSASNLVSGRWFDGLNSQYGSATINFIDDVNSPYRMTRGQISTIFDLGLRDWTFEGWFHQDQEHSGEILSIWGGEGDQEWIWSYRTNGGDSFGSIRFDWTENGTTDQGHSSNIGVEDRGLSHIATTRDGANIRHYRNGVQIGSTGVISTLNPIFTGGSADLVLGAQNNGTTNNLLAKMDSIRVTMDIARYTGATYNVPQERFPHY